MTKKERNLAKPPETALAKPTEAALAAKQVNDMFDGGKPQIPVDAALPQIEVLRETTQFRFPDGDLVSNFTGHILYWHNANSYWRSKFGEGSILPTCASSDAIAPDSDTDATPGAEREHQGEICKTCALNVYGSAEEGDGKACQNMIRMFILVDGEVIPCLLKAPPSSLGKKESLMRFLTAASNIASKAGAGTAYQPIKVKFSLHKKGFTSGMSASVIDLETVTVLTMAEGAEELQKLGAMFKQFQETQLGKIRQSVSDGDPIKKVESAEVERDDVPI